jgi:hypothetical protein
MRRSNAGARPGCHGVQASGFRYDLPHRGEGAAATLPTSTDGPTR